MRKFRTCHVMPSLDDNHGGPVSLLLNLFTIGAFDGTTSRVVGGLREPGSSVKELRDLTDVRTDNYGRFTGRFYGGTKLVLSIGYALVSSRTLVAHSFFNIPTLFGLLAARITKRRRILVPHGSLGAHDLAKHGSIKYKLAAIWRSALDGATIVCLSTLEQEELITFGANVRVHIIYPAISPPADSFATRTCSMQDLKTTKSWRFIYAGRIHPVKNLRVLVEAFQAAAIPNATLTIAGSGHPDDEAALDVAIHSFERPKSIKRLGWQDRDAVFQLARNSDAVILASTSENFGMLAAEALAVGTPVLISKSLPLAPLVESKQAGITFEPTVDGIRHALERFTTLDQSDMRAAAQEAGLTFAVEDVQDAWRTILETQDACSAKS